MRLSPKATARLSAVFEALEGPASLFGQSFVPGMVIVARDAVATASNILANEALFRVGIAVSLLAVLFHLIWGYLLYEVFVVVDRAVARFSLVLLVVNSALQAVAGLILLGPLVVLRSEALGAFTAEQRDAFAYALLSLSGQAYDVFLAFFGMWLVAIGYLVYRSRFMPRFIGVGLILEGLGWVTFLSPQLGLSLFNWIAALGAIGELPLLLWMLIRGVDNEKWRALRDVRVGDAG